MPLLLALASAAVLGAADFLGGSATRRAPVVPVTLAVHLTALAALAAVAALLPPAGVVPADLVWGAAAGLSGGVGLALFYHGLATAPMAVVAPVTAVVSAALPVLAGLAAGERPPVQALAGVGLAIVGIALIGHRPATDPGAPRGRALLVALAAGTAFGGFYVLLAPASPTAGLWPIVSARVAAAGLFLGLAAATRRPPLPGRPLARLVVGTGLLDGAGAALFLLAVQRGPLALVGVLASLYPLTTIVLARLVLHERVSRLQVAGIACALSAIALIVAAPGP